MNIVTVHVHVHVQYRSYAVDEYRKPFWEVFGLYLEDASSLAGKQMMLPV